MHRSWPLGLLCVFLLTESSGYSQSRKSTVRAAVKRKTPPAAAKDKPDAPTDEAKPRVGDASEGQAPAPVSPASAAKASPAAADAPQEDGGAPLAQSVPAQSSPLNPRPEELPDGSTPAAPVDYDRVLGEIASLRARVAAVADTLFQSRIAVRLDARGDHARIGKLTVSLDEGVVFSAKPGFRADDEVTLYEHALAPGRHLLGVEVERRDERGDTFRNAQKSSFTLEVPDRQTLETTVRITDESDMGSDFPSSQKGEYDLRVRVRARARR